MEKNSNSQTRNIIGDLYSRYSEEMKHVFVNFTHNMMEAEDMTQNLFIKMMALDFINPETARNLLLVTAKRMIIDEVRHRTYVRTVENKLLYEMDCTDNQQTITIVEKHNLEELEKEHLRNMPHKKAYIYQLWRMNDLNSEEIAFRLHLSKRTVESHIYHSVKDMRRFFRHII